MQNCRISSSISWQSAKPRIPCSRNVPLCKLRKQNICWIIPSTFHTLASNPMFNSLSTRKQTPCLSSYQILYSNIGLLLCVVVVAMMLVVSGSRDDDDRDICSGLCRLKKAGDRATKKPLPHETRFLLYMLFTIQLFTIGVYIWTL